MKSTEINSLYAAFFNNAEIHFILFDKNLYIIDVNEATLNCYHLERNQFVGKHITEISPDIKEKGLYDKYTEVIRTGEAIIMEDIASHAKFGNQHNRIKAFKVGEGLGVAAINITELKNTVDSLESFILKSSHDLRSPLANIIGLTTLAIAEKHNIEEIINYCNIIKQQAESMDTLIYKLVETMKIRKEKSETQLIKFSKLIDEVKTSLAFVAGFTEVKFTQNIISTQKFYSDRSNLISLFQNLISNAIKYRNKRISPPFIKIIVADDILGIKITISDNGIGIPANLQKNVFKMFFRATNEKDSTGLGLYSVFHIVKKLDGYITFSSEEMVGTTFTIHLPLEEKKKKPEPIHFNLNEISLIFK